MMYFKMIHWQIDGMVIEDHIYAFDTLFADGMYLNRYAGIASMLLVGGMIQINGSLIIIRVS